MSQQLDLATIAALPLRGLSSPFHMSVIRWVNPTSMDCAASTKTWPHSSGHTPLTPLRSLPLVMVPDAQLAVLRQAAASLGGLSVAAPSLLLTLFSPP